MPLSDHPQFDKNNPTSLFSLLPGWLGRLCDEHLDEEMISRTDQDLANELFPDGLPSTAWFRLRISFWDEYDRAIRYQEKYMVFENVYKGIAPLRWLVGQINSKPLFLAWLLCPPPSYDLLLREITEIGLIRQHEVMKLPTVAANGKVNVKLIEMQLKIFQFVDMRLKGAVIQRIEQKNLNVNVDGTTKQIANKSLSLAEVNEQLAQLRKLSEQLTAPANVKLDEHKLITGEIMEAEVIDGERQKTTAAKDTSATEAEYSVDEKSTSGDV